MRNVQALDSDYELDVNLTRVNKSELLFIDNPRYESLVRRFQHLKEAKLNDSDTKASLPIHIVPGNGEYARIKTKDRPLVGNEGDPIAECTKLGWFVMSPGAEFDVSPMMLTQTSQSDYEQLCRLDVLGLSDTAEHDQGGVYKEFREQLQRSPDGWYETGLPWKGNHPPLPTNVKGSLQRLTTLQKRLTKKGLSAQYDAVIEDQKAQGIVEEAPSEPQGKEFYIPHKEVVRETAASTKLRVVYDASARETPNSPSLNDCLYPGPSLQNQLWEVLVRQRAFPVALAGDKKQAFLQIRIRTSERDALRFHWKRETEEVQTLRFTRAHFGLASSPFLLGGVLAAHLDKWEERRHKDVEEIRRSLYVDDLLSGGETVEQASQRKEAATAILEDATFKLHKWASNENALEDKSDSNIDHKEQTAAKMNLGVAPHESKILGLPWNKRDGTLSVQMANNASKEPTKRETLRQLAKFYDPLGIASPITLQRKIIYRDICDA